MEYSDHKEQNYILTAPLTDNEHPFWLCQYGITPHDRPSHEIRLNSMVSCIQYVISGSGTVISDNHSFTVSQGDTFILKEEKNQNYYSNPDNHFKRIWINFKGELGKELLKIYGLDNTVLLKNTNSLDLLTKIHEKCKSTKDPNTYKNETSLLFLQLIQFLSEHKPSGENPKETATEGIRPYIDSHITDKITLSDIARFAHMSKEHVIRTFKKNYNITPHQYIIESRMKIAATMLKTNEKTIEEIAANLNFTDSHHFSSQFYKYYGVRPSIYRKTLKNR